MAENQYPSEVIELPSKGWYYPSEHPLASGTLDIYYMTARHEDILTSKNLIQRGVVIDKLVEALIVDKKIKYDDLLIGDKNGLMIAARIMGYGKDYEVTINCPQCSREDTQVVNLEEISNKQVEFKPEQKGKNEFFVTLPFCKSTIGFRLLTHKDEKDIQTELEQVKKALRSEITTEVTTRMKKSITSVDGVSDRKTIFEFVDRMPARDAQVFREFARKINPDIDLTFNFKCSSCGVEDRVEVPIDVNFFWPNSTV
jgi:hypothetical protein